MALWEVVAWGTCLHEQADTTEHIIFLHNMADNNIMLLKTESIEILIFSLAIITYPFVVDKKENVFKTCMN